MVISIINGPNLNMLGEREPEIYGEQTLEDINNDIEKYARGEGIKVEFFQFSGEGEIIDCLHNCFSNGIILNAGAYSHYSYAIRDAIASIEVPVVEVHLSNIHAREEFRRTSVISPVCKGVICGFGKNGYKLALQAFIGGSI